MKYGGVDLHVKDRVVAVIDEQDRVLYCRSRPDDLNEIIQALAPHRQELQAVVVESTYNWY